MIDDAEKGIAQENYAINLNREQESKPEENIEKYEQALGIDELKTEEFEKNAEKENADYYSSLNGNDLLRDGGEQSAYAHKSTDDDDFDVHELPNL